MLYVTTKVDFVALKDDKPTYINIVSNVEDKANLKKALNSLQRINDQYDKFILSLEQPKIKDHNGIKIFSIFDFITGKV